MPLVAVTRLRVRSWWFTPVFVWFTWRSVPQARRAAGNLGIVIRKAEGLAFWTVTVWQDEAAMRAFRDVPPHRSAMPRLLEWCDEASLAHWNQEASTVPDWKAVEERLADSGIGFPT